ncbi:MAG TPA: hypothetical protein VF903_11205 [Nitrospirota bacterium]
MRALKIALFAAVALAFHAGHAFADRLLKDIPLEWKPTEVVTSFDPIDLSPFMKKAFAVSLFTDVRKAPEEIGKNVERRGADRDLPVTTKDSVASWLSDRFAYVLSEFDIETVKSNAAFTIEADITKFYVTESSMYEGVVGLKVRLRGKNGALLWEGMVSGSASRFGSSYKAENYYEALSNSVIMAVYGLLKNDQFKQAVQKNR